MNQETPENSFSEPQTDPTTAQEERVEGAERKVPQTRQRVKYDKQGRAYVKQGVWLRIDLLKGYDRIVFSEKMRGNKLERYMLINEDMERGLEARRKAYTDKLKAAGQEELDI